MYISLLSVSLSLCISPLFFCVSPICFSSVCMCLYVSMCVCVSFSLLCVHVCPSVVSRKGFLRFQQVKANQLSVGVAAIEATVRQGVRGPAFAFENFGPGKLFPTLRAGPADKQLACRVEDDQLSVRRDQ